MAAAPSTMRPLRVRLRIDFINWLLDCLRAGSQGQGRLKPKKRGQLREARSCLGSLAARTIPSFPLPTKATKWQRLEVFSPPPEARRAKVCGESGIRTHERVARRHAVQA